MSLLARQLICVIRGITLAAGLLCLSTAQADVAKVWNNEPMTLHIKTGQEVRVIFPTNVDLQVPLAITNNLQSLAPNRNMIYWTALENFDKARIIATADDGQDVYILDLMASENGIGEHIVIEDPRRVLQSVPTEITADIAAEKTEKQQLTDPAEIVLTRFAAQSLYAPYRLVPSNPDITLLSTPTIPGDFPLMQSVQGESLAVEVVAAWSGYNQYVTAVIIKNQSGRYVPVNAEKVRGNFTHITPQDLYIGPKGAWDDSTTLYLSSSKPFAGAVMEDGYAY